jgi:hypothetical protein
MVSYQIFDSDVSRNQLTIDAAVLQMVGILILISYRHKTLLALGNTWNV